MAVNVKTKIDDLSKADVDYYIRLEHLDPDSLKIRRWGHPSDVEAQKLGFKKGDIIFSRGYRPLIIPITSLKFFFRL
ncbi:hypothetical protein [Oscillatoria salina]|uniref:hypothetical protein n=1 Tax=Oscillatoria salina TaxID=331517 RepID=UPI0013BE4CB9|nr:hypothetical protein [Oscillatoria salina]MBZ8178667.1 hypothetical protein [Oscillatoria salina IIICB1]NET91432.1 hypothetical protein [Kamptonema sp. SIO1D9]